MQGQSGPPFFCYKPHKANGSLFYILIYCFFLLALRDMTNRRMHAHQTSLHLLYLVAHALADPDLNMIIPVGLKDQLEYTYIYFNFMTLIIINS